MKNKLEKVTEQAPNMKKNLLLLMVITECH
jgi:hypothetical protein